MLRQMEYRAVRRDDDMKVSQERLRAAGWTYNSHDKVWKHPDHSRVSVVIFDTHASVCVDGDTAVQTMGHLLRLISETEVLP